MQALLGLLLLAAPQDLTPRAGSGWEGFRPGTVLKTKTTFQRSGGVPTVQITVKKLTKIGKDTLTLEEEKDDGLRAPQTVERTIPRSGEAAPGEKAALEEPKSEKVYACDRYFACERRQTAFTGPEGKRVVTLWVAEDPKVRVKRLEKRFDADGNVTFTESHRLTSLDSPRTVGGKPVSCLRYDVLQRLGKEERDGVAYVSRDVPGSIVFWEMTAKREGKEVMTVREEVLRYSVR